MIKKLKQSHSIKTLCEVFNVHRSSYNYWLKRPTEIKAETVKLRSLISEAYAASNGSAGARTIADIVTAYFGAFRSVISGLSDHPFRFKPITDSAIIRSLLA